MHVIKKDRNGIVCYSPVNVADAKDNIYVAETPFWLKSVLMNDAGYSEDGAEELVAKHGQEIDGNKLAFVIVHEDKDPAVVRWPRIRKEPTSNGHYIWGLEEEARDEDSRVWLQQTLRAGKKPVTAALVIGEFRENQKVMFFHRNDAEIQPSLEIIQPNPRVAGQMLRRMDLRKFDTTGQMPN